MKKFTKIVKINWVEPKNVSSYGNPSKFVNFVDEEDNYYTGYTASNAQCGYGATNFVNKKCEITAHYTQKGNLIIDYIKEIKGSVKNV